MIWRNVQTRHLGAQSNPVKIMLFSLLEESKSFFFFSFSSSGRIQFTPRTRKTKTKKTSGEGRGLGLGRSKTEENLVFVPVLRRKQQNRKRWEKPAETKSHFPSPRPERDSGALFTLPSPTPAPHTGLLAAALICAPTLGRGLQLLPGPRARGAQAAGARRWSWRDVPRPTPRSRWRPKSSAGSWALSSHARSLQFVRPRRVATRSGQGCPALPGASRARDLDLFSLVGLGQGQGPPLPPGSGSASASAGLPAGSSGSERRPRFPGATVMDVRWPAGQRQRAEALITGLRREPRGQRDLQRQPLWSAFIIHEKQSCLGQTPGRPHSSKQLTTPSPPARGPKRTGHPLRLQRLDPKTPEQTHPCQLLPKTKSDPEVSWWMEVGGSAMNV